MNERKKRNKVVWWTIFSATKCYSNIQWKSKFFFSKPFSMVFFSVPVTVFLFFKFIFHNQHKKRGKLFFIRLCVVVQKLYYFRTSIAQLIEPWKALKVKANKKKKIAQFFPLWKVQKNTKCLLCAKKGFLSFGSSWCPKIKGWNRFFLLLKK